MTATSTAAAAGATTAAPRGAARNPELDAARGIALTLAVIVVVAPVRADLPAWLAPSTWDGASVADHLPAAFATLAGVAIAFQTRRHARRSWLWWIGRLGRRLVVLVGLGLLLAWLAGDPAWPVDVDGLRWTSHLARIGVATVIAIPLVRLPRWGEVAIATALLVGHTLVLLAAGSALSPAVNGLAGLDQQVLGVTRALGPVDPNGLTALAPTLVAILAGFWAGEWLADRDRSAGTGAVLLLIASWAGAVVVFVDVIPANATLWTAPIVLGGVAATLGVLGLAHIATRWAPTDAVVAYCTVLGRESLPAWALAVLVGAWMSTTGAWGAVVDWLAIAVGAPAATVVVGVAVVALIGRGAGALVDRGILLRA